jgi:hypothetical protein
VIGTCRGWMGDWGARVVSWDGLGWAGPYTYWVNSLVNRVGKAKKVWLSDDANPSFIWFCWFWFRLLCLSLPSRVWQHLEEQVPEEGGRERVLLQWVIARGPVRGLVPRGGDRGRLHRISFRWQGEGSNP